MSEGSINNINFPDTFSIEENVVNALIPKKNPTRLFGVSGFLRPFGTMTSSSLESNLSIFQTMWVWNQHRKDSDGNPITEYDWYFKSGSQTSFSWTSNDIYLGCNIYIFDVYNNSLTKKLQEIFLGGPDIKIFPNSYNLIPSLSCNDDGTILAVGISNSDKANGSVRIYNYDSNMKKYDHAFTISNPLMDVYLFGYSVSVQGNASISENYKICIGTLNGFNNGTPGPVFSISNRNGFVSIFNIDPTTNAYTSYNISGLNLGISGTNAQLGWNVSLNESGDVAVVTTGQENNEGYAIIRVPSNISSTDTPTFTLVNDVNMSGVYNYSSSIFFVYHTSPWGYSEKQDVNEFPVILQKVTVNSSSYEIKDINLDGIIKKQFNGYVSGANNNTQIIYGLLKSITFTENNLINFYYNISRVDAQYNETGEDQVNQNLIAIAEFCFSGMNKDTASMVEEIAVGVTTNNSLELIDEIPLNTTTLQKLTSSINSPYFVLSPDTGAGLGEGGSYINIVAYPIKFFFTSANPLGPVIPVIPIYPLSNICFFKDSILCTDQGYFPIQNIEPEKYTINNKPIKEITKTLSFEKDLICIEKGAISYQVPGENTLISQNHKIWYFGKMKKAIDLLGLNNKIYKVSYNKDVLYNVLLEDHQLININNLQCESLNPNDYISNLYRILKNKNENEKEDVIKTCNKFIMDYLKITYY